jgi:aldehyde dehydrogenase (NAD+)
VTSHASSGELVPRGFDYAPAPESRGIVSVRDAYGLFVGGEWREPEATYTTIAPSSE